MFAKIAQRLFAILMIMALVFGFAGSPVAAQKETPKRPTLERSNLPRTEVDLKPVAALMQEKGPVNVVVLLSQPSIVESTLQARRSGFDMSPSAAKSQLDSIKTAQASLQTKLESQAIGAHAFFANQRAYNGIAIRVDSAKLLQISKLPGVARIVPLPTLTADNAYAVEHIGAKGLWDSTALGLTYTGKGVSVGVIDTGIDFMHTNFGGPGTGYEAAATATSDFTVAVPGIFPTQKVIGGWDFAGDAYNANDPSPIIEPDPVPMDCNGHGSHVSGTVAGLGVNADGSTYTGDYTGALDTMAMRIGPGVAPEASLYMLRVFGCAGSTNLTDAAFEWAIDPNGDGDIADHLDVLNLSLGSPYGLPYDSTTLAANAAVEAGIVVVTSAGNSGDTNFIVGSPGVAQRAISTAASVDAFELMDAFTVNSPAGIAGKHPASAAAAWPVSAVSVTGNLKYPADQPGNRNGCSPFPAGYFTGQIALLDWTLPQICGSVGRSGNAVAAGAIGVLMIYQNPILDISITGSSSVPSMITTQAVGNALMTEINAGRTVNVTLARADFQSFKLVDTAMNDMVASFSSRGVRTDYLLKPDIAAPGMTIFSTDTGRYLGNSGIAYQPGNNGVSFNGTSMASPMVAGSMAVLKQVHPDWTPEELKALVMNSTTQDIYTDLDQTGNTYSPSRVGAGLINVAWAAENEVIAYDANGEGAVSLSFGAPNVDGSYTASKTVKVVNKGDDAITLRPSYLPYADLPGVSFTFSTYTLTVPANGSTQFTVTMHVSEGELRNYSDPTLESLQGGLPRAWLAEEAGLIMLMDVTYGQPPLRLPVHAAPRPLAKMHAAQPFLPTTSGTSGQFDLSLAGKGVDTTAGLFYGYPYSHTSLVSAFELGDTSPRDESQTGERAMADLEAVGATSDFPATGSVADTVLFFGVSTYDEWSTPGQLEVDVYLDTDNDGDPEYVLYTAPLSVSNDPTDVFLTYLYSFSSGRSVIQDYINFDYGSGPNTRIFSNSTMVLPVYASDLALGGNTTINYFVSTWSMYDTTDPVDETGWMTYDFAHPAVDLTGGWTGMPMYFDLPGNFLPVVYDRTDAEVDANFKGVLLLHHHNELGARTEVLLGNSFFMPFASK